jgi:S1-C subfamily serine protease
MTFSRRARVLSALVAGVLLPAVAHAQAKDDVRSLEKTFEKIARDATPKTVCVKSYVEKTGDKAGYGTGAIISEDGYILTCAHVIDIAKRCEIILSNGKVYTGKLLGKCTKQDYALVKIEEKGLAHFEIGDSQNVKIGQWVMALGHPGGPYDDVQPTFSAGRITNLHRKLPVQMMDRFYDDGIQTDVPIFAGNSGGPLVDLDGKLIGLNGAIILINENAYAVPIHEPMRDLVAMKNGELVKGVTPSQEDLAEFQNQMDPEMFNKLLEKGMKNIAGKLFGGGKDGENPFGDLGKLFGGKDGENPLGELFKGGGGDLGKMFEKMFGQGGEEDGDEDGEKGQGGGMDLAKILRMFMKMFGGQGGEEDEDGQGQGGGQDMQKMFEGFRKMFEQPGQGEDEEDPAPAPRQRPGGNRLERAPQGADKGGWLGVQAAQGDAAKGVEGVLVDQVVENSPASKGLKKGDVIVAVDGKLTPEITALQRVIRSVDPGTTVTVTVDRSRVLDATVVRERVDVKIKIAPREQGK